MPTYRDEAVVLRTHKLGEAERIVTMLSRQNGKIRAVAKGVRRTASRFGSRLEPFMVVDLQCYRGRSLDIVNQAESIGSYGAEIVADYRRSPRPTSWSRPPTRSPTTTAPAAVPPARRCAALAVAPRAQPEPHARLVPAAVAGDTRAGHRASVDCAVTGAPVAARCSCRDGVGSCGVPSRLPAAAPTGCGNPRTPRPLLAGDSPTAEASDERARHRRRRRRRVTQFPPRARAGSLPHLDRTPSAETRHSTAPA